MGKLARINAQRKKEGLPVEDNQYRKTKRFTREDQNSLTADVLNSVLSQNCGPIPRSSNTFKLGALLRFITTGF